MQSITKQTLERFKIKGIHPAAKLFPLMSVEEFEASCLSVKEQGFQNPIKIDSKQILLDGRNRLLIGEKLGIEPPVEIIDPENPVQWILAQNLHRRQLTIKQRAFVGARIATLPAHRPNGSLQICGLSQEEASHQLGVSVRSIQSAAFILENASEETVAQIEESDESLSAAAKKVKKAKKKKAKKNQSQEPKLDDTEEEEEDPYMANLLEASVKLENSLKKIFQDRFEKLEELMQYRDHRQFQMNQLSLANTLKKLGEQCFDYVKKLKKQTQSLNTKQITNEREIISETGKSN